ncbi:Spore photoproduct lyase [Caloramator mitchellensis]|uniref:Spore photoproduct lyase n=1 Tax=Caloramator mitchellensis TaxID=908809 RepID=A0A0R3K077_CALMK|nr:spore photoproduct lyase [Caloramator mitchellensis]KRQ87933.1 Spore photoproduct lyase [Caloramator mitchellensis]
MKIDLFYPSQVFIEKEALKYSFTYELVKKFEEKNIPIIEEGIKKFTKEMNEQQFFAFSKRSIILGVNKTKKFESCKPSADYQFSLVSGCPGTCEYCYLQTKHACSPYIKIYVNLNDIFDIIQDYINNGLPKTTTFELASTSDPISVEHITGSVKKAIEFFAGQSNGKLRLVTKFSSIDDILNIEHNGNTKIRFSINSDYVINNFEHNTSSLSERVTASKKILEARYNTGFIIAPIIIYEGWKKEYENLLIKLSEELKDYISVNITFELIQYRFTLRSREIILKRFPKTKLNLNEENLLKKWGPYGYYKYVYPKETSNEIKKFFAEVIKKYFPNATIEYFT